MTTKKATIDGLADAIATRLQDASLKLISAKQQGFTTFESDISAAKDLITRAEALYAEYKMEVGK